MPNRLTENLDSDLIEAFAELRSDNVLHRVSVFVEGHEDEAFWYDILKDYRVQKNIEFDITPFSRDNNLTKSKSEVLKHASNTGKHLILCIDSDYDYLLNGHTLESTIINQNQYIFQTYAYSIENIKCYREKLHKVCVNAINNSNQKINLSELLKLYSNIIYPLLLWSLYFASKNNTDTFTISAFSDLVKILENPDINTQCESTIRSVSQQVQTKITELKQTHSTDIQQVELLSQQLRELGLNEDNAYLFMHGHTLFDNVVLMILKPLYRELRREEIRKIRENAEHQTERENQIDHYNNKCKNIEDVLSTNTDFKPCFLYQKIKSDLDLYIQNFN